MRLLLGLVMGNATLLKLKRLENIFRQVMGIGSNLGRQPLPLWMLETR